MSEIETEAAPIMLRADLTREEVKALKMLAVMEEKTVQALLGEIVRARLAERNI